MNLARSYKKLVSQARKQYKQLKKLGVHNDTLSELENQLKVFYSRPKRRKTSMSGISITKSFDTKSKKEMATILRQFLKKPTSRVKTIVKEFQQIATEFKNIVSVEHMGKIESLFKSATPKTQSVIVENMKHRVQQNLLLESLGSDVLNELYHHHVTPLKLDTKTIEQAMINVSNEFSVDDLSEFDTFDRTDLVLQEYDRLKNET